MTTAARSAAAAPGVAIVGCGGVGRKRAQALAGARLVACADARPERADALAASVPGATSVADWRAAVDRPDVDIVVVSTSSARGAR